MQRYFSTTEVDNEPAYCGLLQTGGRYMQVVFKRGFTVLTSVKACLHMCSIMYVHAK